MKTCSKSDLQQTEPEEDPYTQNEQMVTYSTGSDDDDTNTIKSRLNQTILEGLSPSMMMCDFNLLNDRIGLRQALSYMRSLHQQDNPLTHRKIAQIGIQDAGSQPNQLKKLQTLFGHHKIGHVRQHKGLATTVALEALEMEAYASGNHIVYPGTDLYILAHELAHLVEQASGKLRLRDGMGRVNDEHEQFANDVADEVIEGNSVEALLDTVTGGKPTTVMPTSNIDLLQAMPQRSRKSRGGGNSRRRGRGRGRNRRNNNQSRKNSSSEQPKKTSNLDKNKTSGDIKNNTLTLAKSILDGDLMEVIRLLRKGCYITFCDSAAGTLFTMATKRGHKDIMRVLLQQLALYEKRRLQLKYQNIKETLFAKSILIEKDSIINYREEDSGFSALHLASIGGYTDIVQQLIRAGATLDLESNKRMQVGGFLLDSKITALMLAIETKETATALELIKLGANVNKVTTSGVSAIHLAAKTNNMSMVQALINAKANVRGKNNNKQTPRNLTTCPKIRELLKNTETIQKKQSIEYTLQKRREEKLKKERELEEKKYLLLQKQRKKRQQNRKNKSKKTKHQNSKLKSQKQSNDIIEEKEDPHWETDHVELTEEVQRQFLKVWQARGKTQLSSGLNKYYQELQNIIQLQLIMLNDTEKNYQTRVKEVKELQKNKVNVLRKKIEIFNNLQRKKKEKTKGVDPYNKHKAHKLSGRKTGKKTILNPPIPLHQQKPKMDNISTGNTNNPILNIVLDNKNKTEIENYKDKFVTKPTKPPFKECKDKNISNAPILINPTPIQQLQFDRPLIQPQPIISRTPESSHHVHDKKAEELDNLLTHNPTISLSTLSLRLTHRQIATVRQYADMALSGGGDTSQTKSLNGLLSLIKKHNPTHKMRLFLWGSTAQYLAMGHERISSDLDFYIEFDANSKDTIKLPELSVFEKTLNTQPGTLKRMYEAWLISYNENSSLPKMLRQISVPGKLDINIETDKETQAAREQGNLRNNWEELLVEFPLDKFGQVDWINEKGFQIDNRLKPREQKYTQQLVKESKSGLYRPYFNHWKSSQTVFKDIARGRVKTLVLASGKLISLSKFGITDLPSLIQAAYQYGQSNEEMQSLLQALVDLLFSYLKWHSDPLSIISKVKNSLDDSNGQALEYFYHLFLHQMIFNYQLTVGYGHQSMLFLILQRFELMKTVGQTLLRLEIEKISSDKNREDEEKSSDNSSRQPSLKGNSNNSLNTLETEYQNLLKEYRLIMEDILEIEKTFHLKPPPVQYSLPQQYQSLQGNFLASQSWGENNYKMKNYFSDLSSFNPDLYGDNNFINTTQPYLDMSIYRSSLNNFQQSTDIFPPLTQPVLETLLEIFVIGAGKNFGYARNLATNRSDLNVLASQFDKHYQIGEENIEPKNFQIYRRNKHSNTKGFDATETTHWQAFKEGQFDHIIFNNPHPGSHHPLIALKGIKKGSHINKNWRQYPVTNYNKQTVKKLEDFADKKRNYNATTDILGLSQVLIRDTIIHSMSKLKLGGTLEINVPSGSHFDRILRELGFTQVGFFTNSPFFAPYQPNLTTNRLHDNHVHRKPMFPTNIYRMVRYFLAKKTNTSVTVQRLKQQNNPFFMGETQKIPQSTTTKTSTPKTVDTSETVGNTNTQKPLNPNAPEFTFRGTVTPSQYSKIPLPTIDEKDEESSDDEKSLLKSQNKNIFNDEKLAQYLQLEELLKIQNQFKLNNYQPLSYQEQLKNNQELEINNQLEKSQKLKIKKKFNVEDFLKLKFYHTGTYQRVLETFRKQLNQLSLKLGYAPGVNMACFLDTVYQWSESKHLENNEQMKLVLSILGLEDTNEVGNMTEFNITPSSGPLLNAAKILEKNIHAYTIGTAGQLVLMSIINDPNHSHNNRVYLLYYGTGTSGHFEPLWPINKQTKKQNTQSLSKINTIPKPQNVLSSNSYALTQTCQQLEQKISDNLNTDKSLKISKNITVEQAQKLKKIIMGYMSNNSFQYGIKYSGKALLFQAKEKLNNVINSQASMTLSAYQEMAIEVNDVQKSLGNKL